MISSFITGEAAGNTFILCFQKNGLPPSSSIISKLLHEQNKDSFVFIHSPSAKETSIRIFERDESESDMCGNAMCVVGLLLKATYGLHQFCVMTRRGRCTLSIQGQEVRVSFPVPRFHGIYPTNFGPVFLIDVGEPHAVLFAHDRAFENIFQYGRLFTMHKLPRSENNSNYNLTVFRALGADSIYAQTFERGLNTPTQACGTGSLASGILYAYALGKHGLINVHMPGGCIQVNTRTHSISGGAHIYSKQPTYTT